MRAITDWPNQDPDEKFFGIDYEQYKTMWFNICLWTGRFNFYYCMIKFAHSFKDWEEPEWIMKWWT
jgi:hypothetical protein